MRKTITKEVTVCDACQQEAYPRKCGSCGVEHCYNCEKKLGVVYVHAVHFSGSGDGYYCRACDTRLSESKSDDLHEAFVQIRNLRDESDQFYADWKIRSEEAEAALKAINN